MLLYFDASINSEAHRREMDHSWIESKDQWFSNAEMEALSPVQFTVDSRHEEHFIRYKK